MGDHSMKEREDLDELSHARPGFRCRDFLVCRPTSTSICRQIMEAALTHVRFAGAFTVCGNCNKCPRTGSVPGAPATLLLGQEKRVAAFPVRP
jgi:hypothetical protein